MMLIGVPLSDLAASLASSLQVQAAAALGLSATDGKPSTTFVPELVQYSEDAPEFYRCILEHVPVLDLPLLLHRAC